jgi:hypothetical protein
MSGISDKPPVLAISVQLPENPERIAFYWTKI